MSASLLLTRRGTASDECVGECTWYSVIGFFLSCFPLSLACGTTLNINQQPLRMLGRGGCAWVRPRVMSRNGASVSTTYTGCRWMRANQRAGLKHVLTHRQVTWRWLGDWPRGGVPNRFGPGSTGIVVVVVCTWGLKPLLRSVWELGTTN